ncbi:MAG: UDP-N-acetylglucosamine 2-epimerase (hydrolyzing) [Planctomycetes bacterium]|nr:UDP-N-acetylglucosamine 2-epimerase (hydrolyzing) [Planctomycetota bacterium]
MRSIGVVTTSRADYGIYLPVLRRISHEPGLNIRLFVTGMHLSPDFGRTVEDIEKDGFMIQEKVEMLLASDTPEDIAKSMGLGTIGFAKAFSRWKPDILLVLGDRFEMHAAAVAALPFMIPIAHIHGGERTEGAIDEALRHSITKMSHLHFVATDDFAHRVIQMGEEPWRVIISGAPSLDNLKEFVPLTLAELEVRVGMALPERGFLLVTFHPVTLEYEQASEQTNNLLAALAAIEMPVVFTLPNADTAGKEVRKLICEFVAKISSARAVENMGTRGYFSLMARAAAMVGNSSSGLLEAPSFQLPVVNVGTRQLGRVRAANVLDCGYEKKDIMDALYISLSLKFRTSLAGLVNPYGDGNAADRIVTLLKEVDLDKNLLIKHFYDLPQDSRV